MSLSIKDKAPTAIPPISAVPPRTGWRAVPVSDSILALCGLLAAIVILLDFGGAVLAPFKLAMCLVLPGWALMRRLPHADPVARLVWTFATSAAVCTVFALAMVWSEFWHPRPVAAVTLLLASAFVGPLPVSARPDSRVSHWLTGREEQDAFVAQLPWLVLGAAILFWGIGLGLTDEGPLGDFGLLPAFSGFWYLAVALVVGLCIWGVVARRGVSPRLMAASVSGLVVMLYASAGLLTTFPRLPWTYKHVAVTDFVGAVGGVDPSIDIYNRWPGFFSVSAFFGEAIGYKDALAYARWAEIGFALFDVVIVLAIARAISRNPRVYWTATLVFALTNWVNQNYYSPQAFAYTLYLSLCLIALTFLRGAPIRWVDSLQRRLVRGRLVQDRDGTELVRTQTLGGGRGLRIAAICAVLLLQGLIVASHQLTPYFAVLGLLPLFVFGFFKPRWVGPVLLATAVLYLLPNLAYVRNRYGLFSGFNFIANAQSRPTSGLPVSLADHLQETGLLAIAALTAVLALAGFVRHFLRGEAQISLMVGWLAAAPIFGLLGQGYGGEGRLRVYLFALPWLAIGVAWLFWTGKLPSRKAATGAVVSLSLMAALFTGTYFQPEADQRVAEGDVLAAGWLDAHIKPSDLVLEANVGVPLLIGPNYPLFLEHGKTASLAHLLKTAPDSISSADIVRYAEGIRSAPTTYFVFSDSQGQNASARALPDVSVLQRTEQKLAADPEAAKVFDNGFARIYQYTRSPGE